MTTFAKNLKSLREYAKISQKALAEKLDTTFKTISHWETGYSEPSIQQLIELANIFETTIDELVGRTL